MIQVCIQVSFWIDLNINCKTITKDEVANQAGGGGVM